MNISSNIYILIALLIVLGLLLLKIEGVPFFICMIIACLIGISISFLMKFGIIKIEGIDIKK
jgi:hypothetical protein